MCRCSRNWSNRLLQLLGVSLVLRLYCCCCSCSCWVSLVFVAATRLVVWFGLLIWIIAASSGVWAHRIATVAVTIKRKYFVYYSCVCNLRISFVVAAWSSWGWDRTVTWNWSCTVTRCSSWWGTVRSWTSLSLIRTSHSWISSFVPVSTCVTTYSTQRYVS